jgi:hypothetical protein
MNKRKGRTTFLGKWFSLPWYFLVFSVYPVLALMAVNVGQVKAGALWRPLLVSVLLAGFLFFVVYLVLHNPYRAAFLAALWLALFFSYGHIYIMLTEKWDRSAFTPWLLAGWLVLAVLFTVWATRPGLTFREAVLPLNVIAIGLVTTSLVQFGLELRKGGEATPGAKNAPVQELTPPQNPPDVYFFILDSYARADLLQQAYGYDNSSFLGSLQERGFYVAECSMSNYVRTELSVASTLNMSYLQGLDPAFTAESTRRGVLWDSLKHSAVRYNFEQMGYVTVGFATGFAWNELEDADVFYFPDSFSAGMTEFEVLLMHTTLARHADDLGWVQSDEIMGQNFRDRTMNVFDKIDDIARMPEPTFAYIHLISPHPPFVFGPDGEPTHPADFWNEKQQYPAKLYAQGYQNQLTFLNKKMIEAVDTILANSDTPPIIVLQGDHGPWLQSREKRMWILNAYHLPEQADKLHPQISPVNTFRLIFNSYFGGQYGLLEDVSYFSPVPKLYEFSEVPNRCE